MNYEDLEAQVNRQALLIAVLRRRIEGLEADLAKTTEAFAMYLDIQTSFVGGDAS